MHKQFFQQLNFHDLNQFEFEESLRNNRESFDTIRQLSPARFRFRILDNNGHDIMNAAVADTSHVQKTDGDSTRVESSIESQASCTDSKTPYDFKTATDICCTESTNIDSTYHSIHWQCKEPPPATYCA